MKCQILKRVRRVGLLTILMTISLQVNANITFTFEEAGGTVTMTSSGTLDTSNLVSVERSDGWGGTGTENNSSTGDIDIMGGTSFGGIDTQFGFSDGTDASAIMNPGGPFASSDFSVVTIAGSKSFTTYSGFIDSLRIAGIGIVAADMDGSLWTPDQVWTYAPGETLESLGLNPGTFAVRDAATGETITIQVGGAPVAVPTLDIRALTLLAVVFLLLGGLVLRRRNRI